MSSSNCCFLTCILLTAAAAKSLQSCPTLCDPIDGSPPGSCPWDSPGKNTGVGCHFLLQCMKVKSESEVAQSCPTLSDPMDGSLPGCSAHGVFQARVLEWVADIKITEHFSRGNWQEQSCAYGILNWHLWDFPGGIVVKTLPSNAGGVGSKSGQGTKIPHTAGCIRKWKYINK